MKALVVDDSSTMRRILINVLANAGITDVGQAADGQEAVNAVTQDDYHLVLMDWNMPNMTGIDALKVIRANGKQVPVVMVTTEAEKGRVLEALKAGANNYIVKPFKPEAIVSKIQEVMAKAGS